LASVSILHINGAAVEVDADAERTLLSVLRDDLGLTGAKYGCGEGQCGACMVLVNGQPMPSCIVLVGDAADMPIRTVEGFAENGALHPIQRAFLEAGALQCGYCTPGMIVAAAGLLERQPDPTDEEVIRAMQGNICRCGTYVRIKEAIRRAAVAMRNGQSLEGTR